VKTKIVSLIVLTLILGFTVPSYSSDWDIAGKVLTGITGLRILSGGKIDVLGSMTGINDNSTYHYPNTSKIYYNTHNHSSSCRKTWVSDYSWRKKYVPKHTVYDPELGKVVVYGHYVKYKVDNGGYWSYTCPYKKNYHHSTYRNNDLYYSGRSKRWR